MGCCFGSFEYRDVLKNSPLGILIPDTDWDEFIAICKLDTYTISKYLSISKNHAFYVVIDGEVSATLQNTKSNSTFVVRTFYPGDIIYVRNNTIISNDGCFVYRDLKLSFSIKATNSSVKIVTVDNDLWDDFAKERSSVTSINLLSTLNVADLIFRSTQLKGVIYDQLEILAPVMKLTCLSEGDTLIEAGTPTFEDMENRGGISLKSSRWRINKQKEDSAAAAAPNTVRVKSGSSRSGRSQSVRPTTRSFFNSISNQLKTINNMGVIISGSCVSIDPTHSVEDFRSKLAARNKAQVQTNVNDSFKRQHTMLTVVRKPFKPIHPLLLSSDAFKVEDIGHVLPVGTIFGLEYHFFGRRIGLRNVLSCGDALVALFTNETLESMKIVDRKFYKTLNHNFNLSVFNNIYAHIPLLNDISDTDRDLLAYKLRFRSLQNTEVVYRAGDQSDSFYVVVYGSVHEMKPGHVQACGHYKSGQYFGEVALVTESQYTTTIVAAEATVLLAVSSAAFRSVFHDNKSKLAEMNIRLFGTEISLEHLLEHPRGYKLLSDFLEKEHATENIHFWHAVDRFDDMYNRLFRQYLTEIMPQTAPQGMDQSPSRDVSTRMGSMIEVSSKYDGMSGKSGQDFFIPPDNASSGKENSPMASNEASNSNANNATEIPALKDGGTNEPMASSSGEGLSGKEPTPLEGIPSSLLSGESTGMISTTPSVRMTGITRPSALPTGKLLKTFDKNIKELYDVALSIMTKYIEDQSHLQVNIPGKMRVETEENFKMWTVKMPNDHEIPDEISDPDQIRQYVDLSFLKIKDLFRKPKKEIFELLKKDTYARLKQTQEFVDFVNSVKPYDRQNTNGNLVAANSSNTLASGKTSDNGGDQNGNAGRAGGGIGRVFTGWGF